MDGDTHDVIFQRLMERMMKERYDAVKDRIQAFAEKFENCQKKYNESIKKFQESLNQDQTKTISGNEIRNERQDQDQIIEQLQERIILLSKEREEITSTNEEEKRDKTND